MTQDELREKFISEMPMYKAWGDIVTNSVINKLPQGINPNIFFKIKPEPRVKSLNSLIEKAFFRPGKNYIDPYNEITDKVGTRFVVLLESDIEIVKNIINNNNDWDVSLDRDYEEERKKHPLIFDYQSVHYVVRNKYDIPYENGIIKSGTPCEIQVRTLLQHAYAELTHDTIYKPNFAVPDEVYRLSARSIALIETTSELFRKVKEAIDMKYKNDNEYLNQLKMLYSSIKPPDTVERMNYFIYDSIRSICNSVSIDDLREYIDEHPEIATAINKGYDKYLLYRQPVVLLLLYLAKEHRYKLKSVWPYTMEDLAPLFIDLGINPYNYH